ncbi:MAG TPA: GntR family transcriptional regulator [Bradyrhizobium sp.]|nr:GntR family transcriptional regulator [Bradyrhizobium sp.]
MKVIKPEKKPDVTAALREAIICGQLMPNERLIEVELATRFGSNRVQIRTALSKLESEGLVVSEPNRGARVRAVTADEALEITEARAAMETLVATKAAERATENDIARLRNILERMRDAIAGGDLLGYSDLNGELHTEIRHIACHATANRILGLLNSQVVRFQFRAILIPGRAAKSLAEHETIVDAICAHDPERARSAMASHLFQVVDALRQAIASPRTQRGPTDSNIAFA